MGLGAPPPGVVTGVLSRFVVVLVQFCPIWVFFFPPPPVLPLWQAAMLTRRFKVKMGEIGVEGENLASDLLLGAERGCVLGEIGPGLVLTLLPGGLCTGMA